MDPRAGLDDGEKRKYLTLPGLDHRTLGRPARSQSLYRILIRVIKYANKYKYDETYVLIKII
jgi:hypothetical protein